MAFSNIDQLNLGKFLQIAYSEGIRNQISEDYRDWDMIKRARVDDPNGRQINFLFQKSLGPAAVQYANPNFTAAFPKAQQISTSEHTAVFKDMDATIEIEYNLWKRAAMADAKYLEPLALEIDSKMTATKRRLAADLYGDGTGVIGQVGAGAAAVTSPASPRLVFTLSSSDTARGHVGMFEYDDILVLREPDGTASALDTNLATEPVYFKVVDKDREANTVTLEGLDSSFATVANITSISTNTGAGEVFYRFGQETIPDLTASISDYGTVTEVIPGLASLAAADGRTIHGIVMSGSSKATEKDAGGSALDVSMFQALLSQVKVRVGQGKYKWPMAIMAPEALDVLIDSRETDRRFNSVQDHTRGVSKFVYQHLEDSIEMTTSEYVPFKRVYILPESKAAKGKVLEYHGTDFMPVKAPGQSSEFMMKPSSSGGHERRVVSYLEGYGTLLCKHPASIAVLRNFTI